MRSSESAPAHWEFSFQERSEGLQCYCVHDKGVKGSLGLEGL